MTLDTRTPQERAYDLQKSGEMYVKPEQTARLADYAASPESRALYATMSPEARHLADRLIAIIDRMPDDEADRAIDQVCLTLDTLAEPPAPAADPLTAIFEAIEADEEPTAPDNPSTQLTSLLEWIEEHFNQDDAPDVRPYGCPSCDTPVRLSDGCFVCVSCGAAVTPDTAAADWAFHAGERYGAHEGIRIYREGHKWDPPRRASRIAAPAIEVSYLYHDPAHGNDITDKPIGPVAYTDYACDDAYISFDAEGGTTQVSLFGHDPVDIDDALGALANLQAVLSDPRVQALRKQQ